MALEPWGCMNMGTDPAGPAELAPESALGGNSRRSEEVT
jgi:hypothetical protein